MRRTPLPIALAIATAMLAAIGARIEPAHAAPAPLPDAKTLLAELGFSSAEIDQISAGQYVQRSLDASNERELDVAFAFLAKASPTELVDQLRAGILTRVDPNTITHGAIQGAPTLESFAALSLEPDAAKRASAYSKAAPGDDLNLSEQEIAAFRALGAAPGPAAVEAAVRQSLLARVQSYQKQGLAGIAPYARSSGKSRSAGDDLRSAMLASKKLESTVPDAYHALLSYPADMPTGFEESYEWSQFRAHGVPTIALTHTLFLPEGEAWVAAQRQFYVSTGYNCTQAIVGLLPMQNGALVIYANRTSTDQVTGIGGGAKRKIGSKLLAEQLKSLFEAAKAKENTSGG